MSARQGRVVEVVEIVYVHVTVAETPSWCDMEVSDNLVDPQAAIDTAPLATLGVQPFCIVLAFTLLHILSTLESP